jgi:AcrR family transcriptional regulator
MRIRDDNKYEAIFQATIQIVNEIGFAQTTVAKIAKRADVSAATIYIYYDNKDDLLEKTYLKTKKMMSEAVFRENDDQEPVRQRFERFTRNFVAFIINHSNYFLFMEQVSNSPLLNNWCLEETNSWYAPIFALFNEGKKQQLFKQEDVNLLINYSVLPLAELAKSHIKGTIRLDEKTLGSAIQMSWDAIEA